MNRDVLSESGQVIETFDNKVQDILWNAVRHNASIKAGDIEKLKDILGLSVDELMVRLLPLAKVFADPPVSEFYVGAVVLAQNTDKSESPSLYFGGNIEFTGSALNQSIHAEQAATANAWHSGATRLLKLAVNEAPCGHCRQYLSEYLIDGDIDIIISDNSNGFLKNTLTKLLPRNFGPVDLGNQKGLGDGQSHDHVLNLIDDCDNELVSAALSAASESYVPYTGNRAGCAAMLSDGEIVSGRSIESAAYNPTLTPLLSLAIRLRTQSVMENKEIVRLVLVEKITKISQLQNARLLAGYLCPNVELEYFRAN